MNKKYFVYIVECNDSTLYTGYTHNLEQRIWHHNHSTKGAHYTRIRRPVLLKYAEGYSTISEAMKREYAIKKLSREEKLKLLESENF